MKKHQKHQKSKRKIYTLDVKAKAKSLYLIGLTLSDIGKVVDAPVKTVEKWRTSEKWKLEREITAIHQTALDLYKSGKTQPQIAKILNKSVPTIARYIKKARNESEKK